ncbi:hypothetical protein F383_12608 [Gossypium arboreum]|uniref:Uncharacterized protein n=2 Tax=Gossypium arboreum TaxID=29729 RepID=A0A0B0NEU2_GOSAR|nr:hypothetical protein F383_12608 [Gossypium arboreum]
MCANKILSGTMASICDYIFWIKLRARGSSAKFITLSTVPILNKLNSNYGMCRLALQLVYFENVCI